MKITPGTILNPSSEELIVLTELELRELITQLNNERTEFMREFLSLTKAWETEDPDLPIDISMFQPDFKKVIESVNMLKTDYFSIKNENMKLKDQSAWFESILDSVPFPISVTDMNMNWTFLNNSVEKLAGISRKEGIGKPCSTWSTHICGTDKCTMNLFQKGVNNTLYEQDGRKYQIECAYVTDANGNKTGMMEVLIDITVMQKILQYLDHSVMVLSDNLGMMATGNTSFSSKILEADADTREVSEKVIVISNSLESVRSSIENLVSDVNLLSNAAIEGTLDTRADVTRHQGQYRRIVEGVNDMLNTLVGFIDKMPLPIMAIDTDFGILYMNEIGANLLGTTKQSLISQKCYQNFKTSDCKTNNCACAQAMQKLSQIKRETDAHPVGKNLEISYSAMPIRDRAGKVTGAFEFIQDQTASVRLSRYLNQEIKETNRTISLLAEGNTGITWNVGEGDEYTREAREFFIGIGENLQTLAHAINALVNDAHMLSDAAIEGKLGIRADTTRHQGEYRRIIEGVNETLDSVIIPVKEALRVSKEYSNYQFRARVDSSFKVAGDWVEFKNALDNIGIQVSGAVGLINSQLLDLASNAEEATASIEEVSSGAQQIAQSAGGVSRNAEQGNDGITQVLKAMEDLNDYGRGSFPQRAESVLCRLLYETNDINSKEGITFLRKQSEKAMGEITQSANEVDMIVTDINSQMDEIGKIVQVNIRYCKSD